MKRRKTGKPDGTIVMYRNGLPGHNRKLVAYVLIFAALIVVAFFAVQAVLNAAFPVSEQEEGRTIQIEMNPDGTVKDIKTIDSEGNEIGDG